MPLHNGLPRLCDHVLPMFRFARATSIFPWKAQDTPYTVHRSPISICYLYVLSHRLLDYISWKTSVTLARKKGLEIPSVKVFGYKLRRVAIEILDGSDQSRQMSSS